jgi:hypothetical protein
MLLSIYLFIFAQDEAMLFITVRSSAAIQVPKVLQIVEQTKRIRYKAGSFPTFSHLWVYILNIYHSD